MQNKWPQLKNTRENNININDKITIHIMTTLSEL